jgi:hypothetical protein
MPFYVMYALCYQSTDGIYSGNYGKHDTWLLASVASFEPASNAGVMSSELTVGDGFGIGILLAIGAALLFRLGRMMVAPNAVSSSFSVLGDRWPLDVTWGFHLGYAGINVAAYFLVPSQCADTRKLGHLAEANMFFTGVIATRKSVLLWVLGLRFEHVVQFHRWVGRVTVLLALAHSAWYVASWQTDVDPRTTYTDM